MKAIVLFLMMVVVASGEFADQQWQAELKESWAKVFQTYTNFSRKECMEIARKWDDAAKKGNWEIYYSSNKPMLYMYYEVKAREEMAKKELENQRQLEAAYAERDRQEAEAARDKKLNQMADDIARIRDSAREAEIQRRMRETQAMGEKQARELDEFSRER